MKGLQRAFFAWLPLGVAITGLCGLVYLTVQQNYRQSLNDPQIQMAEDAASQLSAGMAPKDAVRTPDTVDLTRSLSAWLAIYTADGVPIVSSGEENGVIPRIPTGVFSAARESAGKDTDQPNEDRVTWQSGAGVRQAIVVLYVPQQDDYVVAGRNMREVENREANLTMVVALAWGITMLLSFCAVLVARLVAR